MYSNIDILIIEDDPQAVITTESIIFSLGYNIMGSVDSADAALTLIAKCKPDILVVDIEINGKIDGIELVEKVKHLKLPVIYTTGNEQRDIYERARQTLPAAYLVKPYNRLTFQSALEQAIKMNQQVLSVNREGSNMKWSTHTFFIKNKNLLERVNVDDIVYVKSDGNYCEIIASKKYVVKMSLSQVLRRLPSSKFIRIHQRYIIQEDRISKIDVRNGEIYIEQTPLPIGPNFKENVMSRVTRLL